MDKVIRLRLR